MKLEWIRKVQFRIQGTILERTWHQHNGIISLCGYSSQADTEPAWKRKIGWHRMNLDRWVVGTGKGDSVPGWSMGGQVVGWTSMGRGWARGVVIRLRHTI